MGPLVMRYIHFALDVLAKKKKNRWKCMINSVSCFM